MNVTHTKKEQILDMKPPPGFTSKFSNGQGTGGEGTYAGAHDYEISHSMLKRDREGIESESKPLTNKGKGLEKHACISAEDEYAKNWHSVKSEFDRSSCNSNFTNRECDPHKKSTRLRYEAPSKNNGEEEVAEDDDNYEEGPEPVAVADSDFYDFDRHRSEECFAVDQMWAIFDDLDGMPRWYARINKVYSPFRVDLTWLDYVATDIDETAWKRSELPVACGVFKHEKTHTVEGISTFSHKIVWQRGARSTYKIYPRKGETWALYKNWNVKWSSDPDNHRKYEYEFVVVLSDYTKSGILVARLVKLKGYVCLFKPVKNNGIPSFQIPLNEMLRFSHRVPSFRTNGGEHKTVPEGYFELDPASLPNNLEEVSDFTDGKAETVDVLENPPMPKKRKILSSDCVTAAAKSITEQIPSSSSSTFDPCELPQSEFYFFETDKTQDKFQAGQLWAVYCELDGLPKYYARIKKVESIPQFKVTIQWLEICAPRPNGYCLQQLDNKIPACCGIFSSGDEMEFHDTLSFSHLVKGAVAGMENKVAIIPRNGEVWAIYRNFSSEWSLSDVQTCKYDIGEVVQVCDIYKVLVLEKVSDYKTVFKAQMKAGRQSLLEIPIREVLRFSHQIPAIQLTDEKEGTLRGCWELDPRAVPVCLFSSTNSSFSKEASFGGLAGAKKMGSNGMGSNTNIAAEQITQGPFHPDSCEITKAQCSKLGKPKKRINSEKKSTMDGRRKPIGGNSSTKLADVYDQPLCKRKAARVSVGKKSCAGPSSRRKNTAAHAKKVIPDGVSTIPVSVDEEIPSSPSPLKIFEKAETEFYNFDNERSCGKFKTGQIWALYCELDELPKNYALIENVESYPLFKLAVKWLKSCNPPRAVIPWVDKGMPVSCGTFKVASGDGVVFTDSISFSHQVSGVAAGNDLQSIYPRVGEVWALYSEFRSDLKCSELKSCKYYMVEVLQVYDASWIIVSLLQRVTGFKMLFSAKENEGLDSIAAAVPWTELYRFSHQVPAFRVTEAKYGKLCGCWELDPRSVPVCLHSTNRR